MCHMRRRIHVSYECACARSGDTCAILHGGSTRALTFDNSRRHTCANLELLRAQHEQWLREKVIYSFFLQVIFFLFFPGIATCKSFFLVVFPGLCSTVFCKQGFLPVFFLELLRARHVQWLHEQVKVFSFFPCSFAEKASAYCRYKYYLWN